VAIDTETRARPAPHRAPAHRSRTAWIVAGAAGLLGLFLVRALAAETGPWSLPDRLQDLLTLSISIIIESLPFVILGVLLSILVQVWIPDTWILRILPSTPILRRAAISFLGMFLPVCECGNVPLARGLLVKGFTVSESMTFLLAAPTPIGTYAEFDDVAPDGSAILVKDIFGSLMVSLVDGTERRLTPSPVNGDVPYSSDPALMPDGRTRVESVVLSSDLENWQRYLVLDDGATSTIVFTPDATASIDGFAVSPNGQYVAIAVIPDVGSSVSDGYYPYAKATSITTFVVEIATGIVIRSFAGFGTLWP
jgi:hypothetical protein